MGGRQRGMVMVPPPTVRVQSKPVSLEKTGSTEPQLELRYSPALEAGPKVAPAGWGGPWPSFLSVLPGNCTPRALHEGTALGVQTLGYETLVVEGGVLASQARARAPVRLLQGPVELYGLESRRVSPWTLWGAPRQVLPGSSYQIKGCTGSQITTEGFPKPSGRSRLPLRSLWAG